jgi:hypothetical protein
MPLQNRVNPEGDICVSTARGTLMGNRGCLHNAAKQIVSKSKRDAWVTCALRFKDVRRPLMDGTSYTELFFLDEATALAAGHRPCNTCRSDRYKAFMTAWGAGNRSGAKVLAGEVDAQMKQDRSPAAREQVASVAGLPDGVIVKQKASATCYLIRGGKLYPWSFAGYGAPQPASAVSGPFVVLTPGSTVQAIRQGYNVEIHSSAR